MSVPTPRRSRSGAPKVRTGCVTSCIKCLSTRGVCGGYYVKPRKNQSWKYRFDPLPLDPVVQPSASIVELGMGRQFENELQHLYFQEWQFLTKGNLGGYISTKLWSTYLPQLTAQRIVLRHAALSLGAMSRALSMQCIGQNPSQTDHYQNAVAYYCKALRHLSQADSATATTQEAMLLAILFTSFEVLRGNVKSALEHIYHGLLVVRELCASPEAMSYIDQLAPDPGQFISEVLALYWRLAIQTQVVTQGSAKLKEYGAMSIGKSNDSEELDRQAVNNRLSRYLLPRPGLSALPKLFMHVDEALEHWEATTRRIERLGPRVIPILDRFLAGDARNHGMAEEALEEMQKHREITFFSDESQRHLRIWHDAFWPLYQRTLATSEPSSGPVMTLICLRIEYLALSMHSMFQMQGNYDTVSTLTPKCREINELCEIVFRCQVRDARGPSMSFSIGTGLTWHLIFVAMNCRDSVVRESAMRILETYPRQDGLWSSKSFLEIARRNRKVEAENCGEGSMKQQWLRLSRRVFLLEEAGERLVFRYMSKENGCWDYIEEYADFSYTRTSSLGIEWKRRPLSSQSFTLQWGRTGTTSMGSLWPGMGCCAPRLAVS
ncbi:unnamed protein product [Clonostachys solani]|uniref:C6 zinc finger domain protein n=1 Tax=Clonostachys solani TaxID=160281 RepID=A0A9N9ZIT3_9HYPO|nr:unnamed protein product [Clonostachys solani]